MSSKDLDFITNELGEDRSDYHGAVIPPIYQTSNFALPTLESLRSAFANEAESHLYTRGNNPTVLVLRKKLAALEQTEDALVFSSGVAAMAAAVMSQVASGDHIICINNLYSWTKYLMSEYLPKFGVDTTFVQIDDTHALSQAKRENTKLLVLESPNSMTFEIIDLEACTQWAKENGIITICDNSYASPIFQNPALFGIDLIVHSGSKYLNGHSDVVCGALCGPKSILNEVFTSQYQAIGAIISPMEAFLILRGLRTLKVRMKKTHETTQIVARYLDEHRAVAKVHFPFLESSPSLDLARKQMSGCPGLLSVEVKTTDEKKIEDFISRIRKFQMAVSWGGFESLMIPILALYHIPGRKDPAYPVNMVRFYCGLEDANILIDDLEQALQVI